MKAIIPTGGRGTRMQPLTFSVNKQFIPLANKPLVFYPIEAVAKSGVKEVAIVYGPGWLDYVKEVLGDGRKWGMKFAYVLQEKPIGLANIFQVCEEFVNGDRFFLHLGDNIFADGINDLVSKFSEGKSYGMVAKIVHPENWRLGVPIFDKKGRLVDYIEKPKNPPNKYAVPGIYFFDSKVFECFRGKDQIKPSKRGEYEILEPYKWLIKRGYRVDVTEYKGRWLDPGKFDDWLDANRTLLDRNCSGEIRSKTGKDTIIEGRVDMGKGCKIKGSELRGPIAIGDEVEITDSYVGPYTSIGNQSIIRNSNLENSVLMPKVKILNIKKQIDESLIGTESEIVNSGGKIDSFKLFIGEKSLVKI